LSNRRKLKAADAGPVERCARCGHRIGANADALRLRTGVTLCPRCREYGRLPTLSCGHVALPGSFIVRGEDGRNEARCVRCAPESAARAGNLRLGMAPRAGS
jgi:hypothetical protein